MKLFLFKHAKALSTAAVLVMLGTTKALATGSGVDINLDGGVSNEGGGFELVNFANNTVESIINILLFLAGAAAVIYLIWAGIRYLTAGGDTKKAEDARRAIINAVIGLIIVVATYFIIRVAFFAGETVNELEDGTVEF